MTKKLKALNLVLGTALLSAVTFLAVDNIKEVTANADTSAMEFTMDKGASVKLDGDGIRFRAMMNQTTYDYLVTNDSSNKVTLSVWIAPRTYFDAVEGENGYDFASLAGKATADFTDKEDKIYQLDDGYYYANAVMTDLYAKNYQEKEFTAVGVITDASGDTTVTMYTEFAGGNIDNNTRSQYYVVNKAFLDSENNYTSALTGSDSAYADWYGTEDSPVDIANYAELEQLAKIAQAGSLPDNVAVPQDLLTRLDESGIYSDVISAITGAVSTYKPSVSVSLDALKTGITFDTEESVNALAVKKNSKEYFNAVAPTFDSVNNCAIIALDGKTSGYGNATVELLIDESCTLQKGDKFEITYASNVSWGERLMTNSTNVVSSNGEKTTVTLTVTDETQIGEAITFYTEGWSAGEWLQLYSFKLIRVALAEADLRAGIDFTDKNNIDVLRIKQNVDAPTFDEEKECAKISLGGNGTGSGNGQVELLVLDDIILHTGDKLEIDYYVTAKSGCYLVTTGKALDSTTRTTVTIELKAEDDGQAFSFYTNGYAGQYEYLYLYSIRLIQPLTEADLLAGVTFDSPETLSAFAVKQNAYQPVYDKDRQGIDITQYKYSESGSNARVDILASADIIVKIGDVLVIEYESTATGGVYFQGKYQGLGTTTGKTTAKITVTTEHTGAGGAFSLYTDAWYTQSQQTNGGHLYLYSIRLIQPLTEADLLAGVDFTDKNNIDVLTIKQNVDAPTFDEEKECAKISLGGNGTGSGNGQVELWVQDDIILHTGDKLVIDYYVTAKSGCYLVATGKALDSTTRTTVTIELKAEDDGQAFSFYTNGYAGQYEYLYLYSITLVRAAS